jgi:hypothetical protein
LPIVGERFGCIQPLGCFDKPLRIGVGYRDDFAVRQLTPYHVDAVAIVSSTRMPDHGDSIFLWHDQLPSNGGVLSIHCNWMIPAAVF